jgi:hypothetical protein
MTSKDRRFGGVFFDENTQSLKGVWIHVVMSLMRHVGNQVPRRLTKLGHACYVVNGYSLFLFGSPSRSNWSQSAIGLP